MSSGLTEAKVPPKLPIGVLQPFTMYVFLTIVDFLIKSH